MNLPPVPEQYQVGTQTELHNQIRSADTQNLKLDQDNFLDSGSISLQSPDGTWFILSVDNSGNLSATELTGTQIDSFGRPVIASSNPYS